MLVEDDGQMGTLLLEVAQHLDGGCARADQRDFALDGGDVDPLLLDQLLHEVAFEHVTLDAVEIVRDDRVAGMRARLQECPDLVARRFAAQVGDLASGDEERGDRQLAELDGAGGDVPGSRKKRAGDGGLLDQVLQLVGREPGLGERRLVAEGPQQEIRDRRQKPDDRPGRLGHPQQRPRDQEAHAFAAAQRERFRHELAEDDRQHRDEGDHEGERELVGAATEPEAGQPGREGRLERRAPERPGGRPEDGDSDLHGGQEALRVLAQGERRTGAAVAFVREFQQPRAAHGEDPDLGGREEAVDQGEHENDEQLSAEAHWISCHEVTCARRPSATPAAGVTADPAGSRRSVAPLKRPGEPGGRRGVERQEGQLEGLNAQCDRSSRQPY